MEDLNKSSSKKHVHGNADTGMIMPHSYHDAFTPLQDGDFDKEILERKKTTEKEKDMRRKTNKKGKQNYLFTFCFHFLICQSLFLLDIFFCSHDSLHNVKTIK